MPKRTDIHKVLIIGSGPIVIGQACEFDYSGTQACKALRELGYQIVLVNSNPATIMTDPGMADVTYVEALNANTLTEIIEKERPDALLPNLGGQTGLNLASELHKTGVLGKVSLFGFTMSAWRVMFLVGTLPALLVILIRRRLKEPERWQQAARQKDVPPPGSYRELFGDPRWRSRAMVGMLLASSGVIGLWGIGFFSIDLNRSVFSKAFIEEARAKGAAEADQEFVGLAMAAPHALLRQEPPIQPSDLISPQPGTRDAERVFWALVTLLRESAGGNGGNVSDPPAGARERCKMPSRC